MKDRSINAGVQTSTGIEFQKHCALYILLENYNDIKTRNYYIYIEHQDDFLFCFRDCNDNVEFIELYQAKKNTNVWSFDDELAMILGKICTKEGT